MPDEDSLAEVDRRTPWNQGKLIGAKPPLRPNQVWSIRTRATGPEAGRYWNVVHPWRTGAFNLINSAAAPRACPLRV
jgi:hypothetical protein